MKEMQEVEHFLVLGPSVPMREGGACSDHWSRAGGESGRQESRNELLMDTKMMTIQCLWHHTQDSVGTKVNKKACLFCSGSMGLTQSHEQEQAWKNLEMARSRGGIQL